MVHGPVPTCQRAISKRKNVLTDTHCHLDLDSFDSDREAVLERAVQVGIGRILIPGLNLPSSRSIIALAEKKPMLFTAIGVHPAEIFGVKPSTLNDLRKLALHSKVKAIGEIGLDYYWDTTPHDHQLRVLIDQLALAAELQLPVVIHFREKKDTSSADCAADLMRILEDWVTSFVRDKSRLVGRSGVLHSFSGTQEMAQAAMKLGFYLGISGRVTFKNDQQLQALVAMLPLDRILLETDAPFQAPQPYRGKRNEPSYLRLIADKIALVRSTTTDQVALVTSENARRLFAWDV